MTTARDVHLSRVPHLRAVHQVVAALTVDLDADVTETVILVPSEPAARELRRTLQLLRPEASALPSLVATSTLPRELHDRLRGSGPHMLSRVQREAMVWRASEAALASGSAPPFSIRAGIVAETLALYDSVRRHLRQVDDFERVLVSALAPGAEFDRGAARLLAQTSFLVAVFREYERMLLAGDWLDEHRLRALVLEHGLVRPIRHMVLTTADHAAEPEGLWPADFDLLTRLEQLSRIDVVATDHVLDSGFRLRLFDWLPGLEERRVETDEPSPTLVMPAPDSGRAFHVFRDREEELIDVCARVDVAGACTVVYERPLPYLYLADRIFGDAGVAFTTADTLPLAAEPYVAVLDLIFEAVSSGLGREPVIRLLESPYVTWRPGGQRLLAYDVWVLRNWIREKRLRGGRDQYEALVLPGPTEAAGAPAADAIALRRARRALLGLVADLAELDCDDYLFAHIRKLRHLVNRRSVRDAAGDREPETRARAATLGLLDELADAYAAYPGGRRPFAEGAGFVRRAIEQHTFAFAGQDSGIRLCDARAARYTHADVVRLVGVNEGDWPRSVRRTIFYPSSLTKDLGFPKDQDRQLFARAAFLDLVRVSGRETMVSVCQLEEDALVRPSAFVEDLDELAAGDVPTRVIGPVPPAFDVPRGEALAAWASVRTARHAEDPSFHGRTDSVSQPRLTVTQIERYLDCPFKYFASVVLRLDEEDDRDDIGLDPRRRGTLMHQVFQQFFEAWVRHGYGAITPVLLPDARALFRTQVDEVLADLPAPDAAIERVRLLGTAGTMGFGERVFRLEAGRTRAVVERLIECNLRGTYDFGTADDPAPVTLTGIADRIDLLADGSMRLVDYKTGQPPSPKRSIQLAVYGLCAEQKFEGYRGRVWRVGEAAYLALGDERPWVSVVKDGERAPLDAARARLLDAVRSIQAGAFPPRPIERRLCASCAFAAVCRKDYVAADA